MAGPGGGREMNGAARCCRRLCQPGPRRVARGGARSQGLPHPPRCTLWEPGGGAGPRNPGERLPPRHPSRPFPHRGGQRRPRGCGDGLPPRGPRSRGGGLRAPHSRPSFARCPFLPVGLETGGNGARGLARQRSEKREALLVGFARLL